MIYCCAHCRGQTTAVFPEGVISPAQYGERVRAAAVYLNVQQLIPEDRVAQAMADLFGAARLCPDSVVAWGKRKAEEFGAVAARIAALVAQAAVRHPRVEEPGDRLSRRRPRANGCIPPRPRRSPRIECRPNAAICPRACVAA